METAIAGACVAQNRVAGPTRAYNEVITGGGPAYFHHALRTHEYPRGAVAAAEVVAVWNINTFYFV